MVAVAVLTLLLAVTAPVPPPTVPDSPGAGLGLEPPPTVVSPVLPQPPPPAGRPGPTRPAALTALIGGMAVLAARARRITGAEREIRDALADNLISDVDRNDLRAIVATLKSLDIHEATAAVTRLSDRELGVWMRELDGRRGGLDDAEQRRYFEALAGRLRPVQLARLTDHGTTPAIVAAALRAAPDPWQVELAMRLWARRGPGDDGWNEIVTLVEEARVGVVGAGLAATNLAALSGDLFKTYERYPGATPALDLEAAHRLVTAARDVPEAGVKAELFNVVVVAAGSVARTKVTGTVEMPALYGALAGLLRSDLPAVVGELNHRVDPHANVTSRWVEEMIRADRIDELDVLLTHVTGAPDRLRHFTEPGSDPADPYPNASNLGYYVGAYARAIDRIADRAEDQVDLVAQLFAIFTGLIPVPGGGDVAIPLSPLVERQAGAAVDGLRAGAADLKQALWGLAKPRTSDGRLWNGAGTSQFQDAWQEVVEVR